jgi:hypothetical protein
VQAVIVAVVDDFEIDRRELAIDPPVSRIKG